MVQIRRRSFVFEKQGCSESPPDGTRFVGGSCGPMYEMPSDGSRARDEKICRRIQDRLGLKSRLVREDKGHLAVPFEESIAPRGSRKSDP